MGISHKKVSAGYVRNFIFGVEDSLVSTVGLLSGVAIAGVSRRDIFLTGFVLIFVEAFSMAVGSFIAEHSAEDYLEQKEAPLKSSVIDGVIMFFSYFITGFIPLFPYFILNTGSALWVSITISLLALFAVGVVSAWISHVKVLRSGLRIVAVGGIAIGVGVIIGQIVNNF